MTFYFFNILIHIGHATKDA